MMVPIDSFLNEGGKCKDPVNTEDEHKSDLRNVGNTAHFYIEKMLKRTYNIKSEPM
jgi:hypothetical protein